MIPPTLSKVGQLTLKCILQQFKWNTENIQEPHISYYKSLQKQLIDIHVHWNLFLHSRFISFFFQNPKALLLNFDRHGLSGFGDFASFQNGQIIYSPWGSKNRIGSKNKIGSKKSCK